MGIIPSPCIKVCRLNEKEICQGCGRTSQEIARWLSYTPQQRAEIMRRCSSFFIPILTKKVPPK